MRGHAGVASGTGASDGLLKPPFGASEAVCGGVPADSEEDPQVESGEAEAGDDDPEHLPGGLLHGRHLRRGQGG